MKYKLLNVLEFTSDRKRMSVIVQDPSGKIKLMCKGADSELEKRLSKSIQNQKMLKKTGEFIQEYAKDGLRTLFLAEKEISHSDYLYFNELYRQANANLREKEELLNKLNDQIEQDLILIGSTAIEDKLQEDVGETLAAFKESGIHIWVLTGDKIETAVNIGYSCSLLDNLIAQSVVDGESIDDILIQLADAQKQHVLCQGTNQEQAIVVSGESLAMISSEQFLMN